jgi:hypothetical protein
MPEKSPAARPAASGTARPLVLCAMPLLGLANQFCAERLAQRLIGEPFGAAWIGKAAASPLLYVWMSLEVLTLTAWMLVLADLNLSAAFPMTAIGYVLVIGLGWTVLHEPISAFQLVGGAAILSGVWLLGKAEGPA